jgi:hypothetical protein
MCLVLRSDGPPAIDWALIHPERVAGPVLLNTYYCQMPTLRTALRYTPTPAIQHSQNRSKRLRQFIRDLANAAFAASHRNHACLLSPCPYH